VKLTTHIVPYLQNECLEIDLLFPIQVCLHGLVPDQALCNYEKCAGNSAAAQILKDMAVDGDG
jgi:hypothetical protein